MLTQGRVAREAANAPVACTGTRAGLGKLPPGDCDMAFNAKASSSSPGRGTLAPGSATLVLRVVQTVNASETELSSKSIPVTLVAAPSVATPKIVSVALQSTTLVIGGASVNYTAQLQNEGPPVTDVLLQGELHQDQSGGTVIKGAGGAFVACGAGLGVLPTTGTGTCAMQFTVTASSSTSGGTLAAGPARFVLHLYKAPPNVAPIEYDTEIIDVMLVPNTPSIVSISLASTSLVIDGPRVNFTATIHNPTGAAVTGVFLQEWIDQAPATSRPAGGLMIGCTVPSGDLPPGTCVVSFTVGASNAGVGTGTLVAGAATFRLELRQGEASVLLDTKTVPITLTGP
jgi:hypothetical protein